MRELSARRARQWVGAPKARNMPGSNHQACIDRELVSAYNRETKKTGGAMRLAQVLRNVRQAPDTIRRTSLGALHLETEKKWGR